MPSDDSSSQPAGPARQSRGVRAFFRKMRKRLSAAPAEVARPPEPPQTVYVPVYGAPPVYPHYPRPQPQPRPPAPQAPVTAPSGGQGMVICAPGKPCIR